MKSRNTQRGEKVITVFSVRGDEGVYHPYHHHLQFSRWNSKQQMNQVRVSGFTSWAGAPTRTFVSSALSCKTFPSVQSYTGRTDLPTEGGGVIQVVKLSCGVVQCSSVVSVCSWMSSDVTPERQQSLVAVRHLYTKTRENVPPKTTDSLVSLFPAVVSSKSDCDRF